ncbi:unnamed protein product [Linum trigynum]|uniref:Uncharacterized protein n=1 Tax=Linum trigynum TaxID=586398 RepID=A0AAV2GQ91_9ROSI
MRPRQDRGGGRKGMASGDFALAEQGSPSSRREMVDIGERRSTAGVGRWSMEEGWAGGRETGRDFASRDADERLRGAAEIRV